MVWYEVMIFSVAFMCHKILCLSVFWPPDNPYQFLCIGWKKLKRKRKGEGKKIKIDRREKKNQKKVNKKESREREREDVATPRSHFLFTNIISSDDRSQHNWQLNHPPQPPRCGPLPSPNTNPNSPHFSTDGTLILLYFSTKIIPFIDGLANTITTTNPRNQQEERKREIKPKKK